MFYHRTADSLENLASQWSELPKYMYQWLEFSNWSLCCSQFVNGALFMRKLQFQLDVQTRIPIVRILVFSMHTGVNYTNLIGIGY